MPDDLHYGMKRLALHNWREPDVPKQFPGLTEEVWLEEAMEPQLIAAVPEDVFRLFEIARGSILYGWFFYPLHSLASEQLHRVEEAAARAKCKLEGIPTTVTGKGGKVYSRKYADLIQDLALRGLIRGDEHHLWDAARKSRNHSSHPERPEIRPPGMALSAIAVTARKINQLFDKDPDYFSMLGQTVRKITGVGSETPLPTVVGIHIGEATHHFHLVALGDGKAVATFATDDPRLASDWCLAVDAKIVAVDAPSGWCRADSRGRREAEELLAFRGYECVPTPQRESALTNPRSAWLLVGERLYQALSPNFPRFDSQAAATRYCFETYPYLASCGLSGRRLEVTNQRRDRRDIVRTAGLDDRLLRDDGDVDAAICALTACAAANDCCVAGGNSDEGFIVAPGYP
jgi:predicted nuclease with RNAse H fold